MKKLISLFCLAVCFASCANDVSPLDDYIKATIRRDSANYASMMNGQRLIDSVDHINWAARIKKSK